MVILRVLTPFHLSLHMYLLSSLTLWLDTEKLDILRLLVFMFIVVLFCFFDASRISLIPDASLQSAHSVHHSFWRLADAKTIMFQLS